jgi:hypothetical protein
VCGTLCYELEIEIEGKSVCRESCNNENHYEGNMKGIYVEKQCTNRNIVSTLNKVCGSGSCYASEMIERVEIEEGMKEVKQFCIEECENPKFEKKNYIFIYIYINININIIFINVTYIIIYYFNIIILILFNLSNKAPSYPVTIVVLFVKMVKCQRK